MRSPSSGDPEDLVLELNVDSAYASKMAYRRSISGGRVMFGLKDSMADGLKESIWGTSGV